MKVYRLQDFNYEPEINYIYGIDAEETSQLSSDIALARTKPLRETYTPLPVTATTLYPDKPIADLSWLWVYDNLVMSRKAVDTLYDLLEGRGELLPLDYDGEQEYFTFHFQRFVDLDVDKCFGLELRKSPFGMVAFNIEQHVFKPKDIANESFFSIIQLTGGSNNYYITDVVKERLDASDLICRITTPLVWDSENPDLVDERFTPEQWANMKERAAQPKPKKARKRILKVRDKIPVTITPFPKEYIAERKEITQQTLSSYQRATKDKSAHPDKVVQWIDSYIDELCNQQLSYEDHRDHAFELGTLLGEQIVMKHGWAWCKVDDDFAVISPEQTFYVVPVNFIGQFFHDPTKINATIMLWEKLQSPTFLKAQVGETVKLT